MRLPGIVGVAALGLALAAAGCSAGSGGATRSSGPSPAPSSGRSSPGRAAASAVPTESNPPGDIPDSQVFVAWSPKAGGYSVKVPEGWSRTPHGAATVFSDKFNSVQVERRAGAARPTVASVRSTDVPAVRATSTGFSLVKVRAVRRGAGPVVLAEYRAESTPNQVTGKAALLDVQRYAFFRPGKGEVVLTLSGVAGSDNVDPWRTVTDSFRWT